MADSSNHHPTAAEIGARYGLDQADVHDDIACRREVVCHLNGIVGWDAEGKRASLLVGKETREFKNVIIFITVRRDFLYAHSNFVKGGCKFSTKLASNQKRSLDVIVANLVATEEDAKDPFFRSRFSQAMVQDFIYFIDANAITDKRYDYLDFSGLSKATVILPDGSKRDLAAWRRVHQAHSGAVSSATIRNPWIPGLFYLMTFIGVILVLKFVAGPLQPYMLPLLVVGALLALAIVGAFTLKNQELLQDKTFLELMKLALQQLEFFRNKTTTRH